MWRTEQLEVARREAVEPHVILFGYPADAADMFHFAVFGKVEVMQNGSSSDDPLRQLVYAEALERVGLKMRQEALVGSIRRVNPVVELVGIIFGPEIFGEHLLFGTLKDDFLGAKTADELVDIFDASLGAEKFAGTDVEKGDARGVFAEVYAGEEIVFLVIEYVVVKRDTRRHQFRNAALDDLLGQFGIFQLLADSHPLTGAHELGQVGIQRMIGKTGKLDVRSLSIGAAREGDTEDFGREYRIFRKRFVKVADAEQQY